MFPRHVFTRQFVVVGIILLAALSLWHFQKLLYPAWTLLTLPFSWPLNSAQFLISSESDGFDLSFASYNKFQTTAAQGYSDRVPAILHHIPWDSTAARATWNESRNSCLNLHPGWDHHLRTDENANQFVKENFPDFKATWDAYPFPIQRRNALKYLLLYRYGGVILDMDLKCKRAVGPLRRFDFVAPAAPQTGFSIDFMMASRQNELIGALIHNLKVYNHRWFGLPYLAVLFSTGRHFASTIHASQRNRAELKILAGPPDNFTLHCINGRASTPIFDHLYDLTLPSYNSPMAISFISLDTCIALILPFLIICIVGVMLVIVDRLHRAINAWASSWKNNTDIDPEKANLH